MAKKNLRTMLVSGGWRCELVKELKSIYLMHHGLNASTFVASCYVRDQVSAPQKITGRMKARQSRNLVTTVGLILEYQMFRSREVVQFRAIAMRFFMSC